MQLRVQVCISQITVNELGDSEDVGGGGEQDGLDDDDGGDDGQEREWAVITQAPSEMGVSRQRQSPTTLSHSTKLRSAAELELNRGPDLPGV